MTSASQPQPPRRQRQSFVDGSGQAPMSSAGSPGSGIGTRMGRKIVVTTVPRIPRPDDPPGDPFPAPEPVPLPEPTPWPEPGPQPRPMP